MNQSWNPWKFTAIGMGIVLATALVTGIVVAKWGGGETETAVQSPAASPRVAQTTVTPESRPAAPAVPTQAAIDACNQHAANQVGQKDKTMEVVKDAAIGAVVGAAVGAAGGAIADGGKGAGKGAAIGGVVGAGGGTLYGLNENKKQDERYRAAYSSCMRGRGYSS
jgi:hypothetical protein